MSDEYNTSPYDDGDFGDDDMSLTSNERKPMSKNELKSAQLDLRHKRKISKMIERDKLHDNIEDGRRTEIMEERDPGGEKKVLEKYGPDGPHDNPVMNFLTSSDPMGGVTDFLEDRMNYKIMDATNKGRHQITKHRVSHRLKHKGYDKNDRKLASEILANQAEYGNDALDSARLERHISDLGKDGSQSENNTDMQFG